MSIQDTALNLDNRVEFRTLKLIVECLVALNKDSWGNCSYEWKQDLERQWYPIFITKNRWLAETVRGISWKLQI